MPVSRTTTPVLQTNTAKTSASSVSVGTSSTQLVAANPARVALIVCNDHSSQTVYLALGATAIANKGLRLTPVGGSVVIDNFTGAVNAIATGASTGVSFTEV